MRRTRLIGAGLALLSSAALSAQTNVPGDPHAGDPVGIVADPCPVHPHPQGDGWQMWNLHMLTRDFGQLCRYAAANAALKTRPRVVFMGDSISDNWINADPSMFEDGRVDRGISGQTTPQMVLRVMADVVALRPRALHLMAGTNDIAGNTGPMTPQQTRDNVTAMIQLARANRIEVLLGSIPPAANFPWRPGLETVAPIRAFNAWAREAAPRLGARFVDYTPVLADAAGGMRAGLAYDGVHPTERGYDAMATVIEPVLRGMKL